MARSIMLKACLAAFMVPAIAGCGYHHIGPVDAGALAASQPIAPAQVYPTQTLPTAPSAYFPTQAGTVFHYTRTDATQGALGMRTMTIGAAGGSGVSLTNLVSDAASTGDGQSQSSDLTGSVATNGQVLTATVTSADTANTLMSFQLQGPLQPGRNWSTRLGIWNWNYVVRNPESVWSPAGNFQCLVVQGNATRALMGALTQIQQTMYFAPGVGLVKVEIKSQSEWGNGNDGRTITETLASVDHG
ncbi:MAG TPA: hypothetical protein V6D47_02135 [Oscillatoriaceae cyanobacterium]